MRLRMMASVLVASLYVISVMGFLTWRLDGLSSNTAAMEGISEISAEMVALQRANAGAVTGVIYVISGTSAEQVAGGAEQMRANYEKQLANVDRIRSIAAESNDAEIKSAAAALAEAMAPLKSVVDAIAAAKGDPQVIGQLIADPQLAANDARSDAAKVELERVVEETSHRLVARGRADAGQLRLIAVLFSVGAVAFSALAGWTLVCKVFRRLGRSTSTLASAATDLSRLGEHLQQSAAGSAAGAAAAADRAEQVGVGLREVAAAIDQLGQSAAEIVINVSNSQRSSDRAVTEAEEAARTVHALSVASSEIGDVVNLIASVARQTNLLALNATIEAARAGDAGRGFAVVAEEVKALATQTSEATADISQRITTIQTSTTEAASAMQRVTAIVEDVSGRQNAIAAAAEEQTAAARSVSYAMEEAASNTVDIIANAHQVASSAAETHTAQEQLTNAIARVGDEANELKKLS